MYHYVPTNFFITIFVNGWTAFQYDQMVEKNSIHSILFLYVSFYQKSPPENVVCLTNNKFKLHQVVMKTMDITTNTDCSTASGIIDERNDVEEEPDFSSHSVEP